MANLDSDDFKAILLVIILAVVFGGGSAAVVWRMSHVEMETKIEILSKTCHFTEFLRD